MEPGHHVPANSLPVTREKAVADLPTDATVLGRIQAAAGDTVALRNSGPDRLHPLCVDCSAG